ncbi:endonuclease III domain-containing protein [Azospirillum sp. YIM DDC1]|uniref:Endonuclease III domain-containing protein n=1 Tax=Azospirillum aestuarii TaxID=2802052 RepID=A0ABS1I7X9_9PROT|nr:endonuclease III domain-containing protein [Azospirillum aestuarii]MBK4723071.1 endonuclease III domain-containing protein [Azospirillum aestuarii]
MQVAYGYIGGEIVTWTLPDAEEEVMPGVKWGRPGDILSPAFWSTLARTSKDPTHGFISDDGDLAGQVGFCLLGGYGITAEMAQAAYGRLFSAGVFQLDELADSSDIQRMLEAPLDVDGRLVRYRFPRQRSLRIVGAMRLLRDAPPRMGDPLTFRSDLMAIPGIGPKTASWIVRNHTGCDSVAILDIHIVRACQAMKLFGHSIRLPKDYEALEARFLEFARRIGVGAGILDAIMWSQMRRLPLDLVTRH